MLKKYKPPTLISTRRVPISMQMEIRRGWTQTYIGDYIILDVGMRRGASRPCPVRISRSPPLAPSHARRSDIIHDAAATTRAANCGHFEFSEREFSAISS